jgi:peroxiredoxin
VSRIRKHIILVLAAGISALLLVQYLRLLQPAQARAVQAACNGMRPSPTNPIFGNLGSEVAASDFQLQDTEGQSVSLSQYRGKIVIVNFWASWCAVCRSEKPSLEKLHRDYSDDGVVVLAVASDTDWAPVKRAMLGFEVATAEEVLRKPDIYGVRDASKLPASGQQVVVARIDRDRAAHKSGLHRLDRIISVNGTAIESMTDLDAALRKGLSGSLTLSVSRLGVTKSVTLSDNSPLHVLLDPPPDDGNLGAIAKNYGITAVPESFVVDRTGKIRHYFINKRNWDGDVAATCLQDLIDG